MADSLTLVVSAARLRDGRVVDLGISGDRITVIGDPHTLRATTRCCPPMAGS